MITLTLFKINVLPLSMHLILASKSEDRKKCFERAKIAIRTIPSYFNEDLIKEPDPLLRIQATAKEKCRIVKELWLSEYAEREGDALIIAADTMGLFADLLIGKPVSKMDAFQMIRSLAGNTHSVYTALHLMHSHSSQEESTLVHSRVHFQTLSEDEIWAYLEPNTEYLTRAAAYSIIDRASLFIDRIEGSFSNIIGLPMAELRKLCLQFNVDLFKG